MSAMPLGMWVVIGWMIFVPLTVIIMIVYAWKTGQFKHIEEAKFRMLENYDPEPWPDKEGDPNDPERS